MRIGMGFGPFYASTNVGGRRRRRKNDGQGCLWFLLFLVALLPLTLGWWSLFIYVPVAAITVALVTVHHRKGRPQRK